jgi:hypothetical protein
VGISDFRFSKLRFSKLRFSNQITPTRVDVTRAAKARIDPGVLGADELALRAELLSMLHAGLKTR